MEQFELSILVQFGVKVEHRSTGVHQVRRASESEIFAQNVQNAELELEAEVVGEPIDHIWMVLFVRQVLRERIGDVIAIIGSEVEGQRQGETLHGDESDARYALVLDERKRAKARKRVKLLSDAYAATRDTVAKRLGLAYAIDK